MRVLVLILDIDGVLNSSLFLRALNQPVQGVVVPQAESTEWWGAMIDPAAVERLNRSTDATGAKIVWSTSWRFGVKFSNTKAAEIMAAAGVTGEYIGMTPTKMSSPPREQEIEWWLEKHPEVERWVALDDGLLELDHLKGGGFVRTSYATGLLDEHVEAAIAVLEGENVE